ncbi:CMGC/CDK protein kinase [Exophiala aquamarina CBS 119918]|uniref:cyclin-dependent kinase n=1 Tax=Exophiala aquamarina CBS 119918 TaxID=1182545 RepID=A0A072P712_9EURO|nr:CMGC/CDK protein kinase [Exophiala aquamarina CBS 119918]KEF55073.1 CMGC/CDK protein kinase [Exophiala aquamarina CBS 119918]
MPLDVSFSTRLTNILWFTNAFITAGKDAVAARNAAKELEEEILHNAGSLDEYEEICSSTLAEVGVSGSLPEEPADHPEEAQILNVEGPSYGGYQYATYHADGQFSTIFKAQAKDESAAVQIVALKVTRPAMTSPPHNPEREARLLTEAKHQHVLPLIETIRESGGVFVLVLPFLTQDLENLLRSGRLDKGQVRMVFLGLFRALTHIHSLGIIHRDVKPANILLKTMNGPVYLADFGIAWSPQDRDSEPANLKITDVGTACYRPPELLFGHKAYDTSLDMWAAGCVVAELLKDGHHPLFDAGPLGSELSLIKSIFSTLGTPNDDSWPSAHTYPDWGKMRFKDFPPQPWQDLLPGVSDAGISFVESTVCYESSHRLTAGEVLHSKKPVRTY